MRAPALFVLIALWGCIYPGQSISDNTIDYSTNDAFVLECLDGDVEGEAAAFAPEAQGTKRIEDVVDLWSETVPGTDIVLEIDGDRARLAVVHATTGRTVTIVSLVDFGNGWLQESMERCASP